MGTSDLVTATIEDMRVLIQFPDGTEQVIPHKDRRVAGLHLRFWVADRTRIWSEGKCTAQPIDREPETSGWVSLGTIFTQAADVQTRRFSLRPL